jgi:signal transduction histidine kinase
LKRLNLSLQFKFMFSILAVTVPVLGLIFVWANHQNEKHCMGQVLNQARVLARQIILTRQWVADCGGVMVRKDSKGERGFNYFYDDSIKTSRGVYQRFTPAMVTKRLSAYSMQENLYRFRLASFNPKNPGNKPNAFEKKALDQFIDRGVKEVYLFHSQGKTDRLMYSVPLIVNDACLKCHLRETFKKGKVGGCLSVYLPVTHLKSEIYSTRVKLAGGGIFIFLLATGTLFFMLRHVVIRPLANLENMAEEIGRRNFEARVDIKTGDELERLGKAFNLMGEKLSENNKTMEAKISRAIEDVETANRDLIKLDSLKTEFFTDMSHELRSPMTAIQGSIDYLKRTLELQGNLEYIFIIKNSLNRMTHLVDDMFDITRIEAGKVEWVFEKTDIAVVIRQIIEIVTIKAAGKSMTIEYDNPVPIYVDLSLERIEQVLINLIENAIKFSGKGAGIRVNAAVKKDQVLVSVADQGIGVQESDRENVFNKFYTLPSAGGRGNVKGTGLGLTICRKIINAHGGEIWGEENPGGGSVFSFAIPLIRQ